MDNSKENKKREKSPIDEKIGSIITSLRKSNGVTQTELAERIGTSQDTISKLEKGDIEFTVNRLYKIADALNVSIEYFLLHESIISDNHNNISSKYDILKNNFEHISKLYELSEKLRLHIGAVINGAFVHSVLEIISDRLWDLFNTDNFYQEEFTDEPINNEWNSIRFFFEEVYKDKFDTKIFEASVEEKKKFFHSSLWKEVDAIAEKIYVAMQDFYKRETIENIENKLIWIIKYTLINDESRFNMGWQWGKLFRYACITKVITDKLLIGLFNLWENGTKE